MQAIEQCPQTVALIITPPNADIDSDATVTLARQSVALTAFGGVMIKAELAVKQNEVGKSRKCVGRRSRRSFGGSASAQGVSLLCYLANCGSSSVTNAALRRPPSVAQRHQFDYTPGCPELPAVNFTAASWHRHKPAAVDAIAPSKAWERGMRCKLQL